MVVSLKANKKRILAFLILVVVVVGACLFLRSGGDEEPAQEITGGTNEERVLFLQGFGWQVSQEPAETREVMIPAQFNDVYQTYNEMQKAQGFDLKPYAGETCTQYKYKIDNYPNETEVYATLLVYGNLIIGGDVACAEVDGFMHGFAIDSARYGGVEGGGSSMPEQESSASSSIPESSALESCISSAAEGADAMLSSMGSSEVSSAESTAAEPLLEDVYPTD